jgi:hypothetical protein
MSGPKLHPPIPANVHVEQRQIEVLHSEADRVFVRGLLSDGDIVVASGAHRISPGQRVVPTTDIMAAGND